MNKTVNLVDVLDFLGLLKVEVTKAMVLSWDVEQDYFQQLGYAIDRHDWLSVRMLAEFDSVMAGAKSQIITDQIEHMMDMINKFRGEIDRRTDDGTIQRTNRQRTDSNRGVWWRRETVQRQGVCGDPGRHHQDCTELHQGRASQGE